MNRCRSKLCALCSAIAVSMVAATAHATEMVAKHGDSAEPQSSAICRLLGTPAKVDATSKCVDLNGDGFVNVLDAALYRLQETNRAALREGAVAGKPESARIAGEEVIVEPASTTVLAGNHVTVLFLLRSNMTPLLGYTLNVKPVAQAGAIGTITPNVVETNFFDPRNIITAGGAPRDPFFSVIQDDGAGGVSVSTMTDDLSTVVAVEGVNDAFAEVVLDVTSGTKGDFLLTLGPGSAISDGNGQPIPFDFTEGSVRVLDPAEVPAVSTWGIGVLGLTLLVAGTLAVGRFAVREPAW